jgi:hypothetical protein
VARLDRGSRQRLVATLTEQLPPHWKATEGVKDKAFVEVDQDGHRPGSRFPLIGSTILRIEVEGDVFAASAFKRVRCPPGYVEARKPDGVFYSFAGRGWAERIAGAVIEKAVQRDKAWSPQEP